MKKLILITLALSFTAFSMYCGGGEDTAKKAEKTTAEKPATLAESGAYMAMEVTNGGTVKGTVTFAGAIPAKQKLEITKDVNICGKQPHFNEDLVVSENKGVANVVVSLANINKGKAMSTLGEAFELDQQGCGFKPHVVLVPAGAELTILNNDGILHNIHTYSEINSPINMAQPGFKKKMVQTFDEAEVIRVACDVHNWMKGYIVVVDHPYYALTDANGNFEITDVLPGTYTVEYWQETLGKQTMEVTVPEGGTVEANFEFAAGSARAHKEEHTDHLASLD